MSDAIAANAAVTNGKTGGRKKGNRQKENETKAGDGAAKTVAEKLANGVAAAANTVVAAGEAVVNGVSNALGTTSEDVAVTNGDKPEGYENAYIKELQKSIRNVTKKLAATAKTDSVIAENPGVSLDELVASKKLNADQKAQALKKPALQAQLASLEEQIAAFRKVESDFQTQLVKEKEQWEATGKGDLERARSEWEAEARQNTRAHLLTLSTFLRAAAARRQIEDETSEESKAFEGLLLWLYGGDSFAVDAAEKLIYGADEGVLSTENELLQVTYATIKQLANDSAQTSTGDADVENGNTQGVSDPTITHAGLTELPAETPPANGTRATIEQTSVDEGAANAVAAANWEHNIATPSGTDPMQESWVSVPRPADETEHVVANGGFNDAGNTGNVAAGWGETSTIQDQTASTSWADDAPDITPTTSSVNDGFSEVFRHRGRGRGGPGGPGFERGRGRGRGRGGFRGRGGPDGEFRGRGGRGGPGGHGGHGGHGERGDHGERRGRRGRGFGMGQSQVLPTPDA